MDLKMMIDSLSEIGLTDEQKRTARKLYCRCGLIDEMHESQRKVDRMDYLIRKAEKEKV